MQSVVGVRDADEAGCVLFYYYLIFTHVFSKLRLMIFQCLKA